MLCSRYFSICSLLSFLMKHDDNFYVRKFTKNFVIFMPDACNDTYFFYFFVKYHYLSLRMFLRVVQMRCFG